MNQKLNQEVIALRRDTDRVGVDCHELTKEVRACEAHNADLSLKNRDSDANLKALEEHLYATRRDIDGQKSV